MVQHLRLFLFAGFIVLSLATARDADALDYRKLPWHLADVWWVLEQPVTGVEEIAIDVAISSDPGQDVPLYIAPTGLLTLNGERLYGGLQTHLYGRTNHRRKPLGRGVLFSRWGERRSDHARPAPGGYGVNSDAEGGFIGVRKSFRWSTGTYEVTLTHLPPGGKNGPGEGLWVRYRICAKPAGTCVTPGALKFPGTVLTLDRSFNSFVEVYGNEVSPEDIPETTVVFSNLRINGRPARLQRARAYYPGDVPPYAEARVTKDGAVRIEIGRKAARGHLPLNRNGAYRQDLLPTGKLN